jgi:hypothetical protein
MAPQAKASKDVIIDKAKYWAKAGPTMLLQNGKVRSKHASIEIDVAHSYLLENSTRGPVYTPALMLPIKFC